jgi:hypothetical protein
MLGAGCKLYTSDKVMGRKRQFCKLVGPSKSQFFLTPLLNLSRNFKDVEVSRRIGIGRKRRNYGWQNSWQADWFFCQVITHFKTLN